jgi:hypothetical protein
MNQLDIFLWGCIKENIYIMEIQDYNNMNSCILVPATNIQVKPRHWFETDIPFTIAAKHAWELEKTNFEQDLRFSQQWL